jgi:hypothetical protein
MHKSKNLFVILSFLTFLIVVSPPPAQAYLDPGTGSYFMQVLIAGGLSIGLIYKTLWSHIKNFINSIKNKSTDQDDKKDTE